MNTSKCKIWPGTKTAAGYGRIGHFYAHRFVWGLLNGPIPDGLFVCHSCDNPPCLNPSHLFLGTCADNQADMFNKGRGRRAQGQYTATSKLSDIEAGEIKARVRVGKRGRGGHPQSNIEQLAAEYGVTSGTIYGIASGRTWKHIPKRHLTRLSPSPRRSARSTLASLP